MFARHVEQADKGCDFDFLTTEFGAPVPEPEINWWYVLRPPWPGYPALDQVPAKIGLAGNSLLFADRWGKHKASPIWRMLHRTHFDVKGGLLPFSSGANAKGYSFKSGPTTGHETAISRLSASRTPSKVPRHSNDPSGVRETRTKGEVWSCATEVDFAPK